MVPCVSDAAPNPHGTDYFFVTINEMSSTPDCTDRLLVFLETTNPFGFGFPFVSLTAARTFMALHRFRSDVRKRMDRDDTQPLFRCRQDRDFLLLDFPPVAFDISRPLVGVVHWDSVCAPCLSASEQSHPFHTNELPPLPHGTTPYILFTPIAAACHLFLRSRHFAGTFTFPRWKNTMNPFTFLPFESLLSFCALVGSPGNTWRAMSYRNTWCPVNYSPKAAEQIEAARASARVCISYIGPATKSGVYELCV